MKKLRKILRMYYVRQIVACWVIWSMMLAFAPVRVAMATPDGGVFTVGTGDITQGVVGGNNTVVVHQAESVIQWGSPGSGGIDTSSSESLSFSQLAGLSNSAVLNRIMSGNMTQFNGTLNGVDMRIFIVNPAGIIFGNGATINVSQLVASGLNMSDDAFHNAIDGVSKMVFTSDGSHTGGDVKIQGVLNAENTGSLYFVGEDVRNDGYIHCPGGLVVMVAGDEVYLAQPGSPVIVELADLVIADNENKVINNGSVGETGQPVGKLVLAAGDLWSKAIKNVKTVEIDVAGEIEAGDLAEIEAYSGPGSDAVAGVSITSGGNVTIDDDITATANGEGEADNATATINIDVGGNLVVENGVGFMTFTDTEVKATAKNSLNNTATVNITADGDVDVTADFANAKVVAEAYNELELEIPDEGEYPPLDGLVNTAKVDITAKSVDVRATNGGTAAIEAEASNKLTASALDNEGEPLVVTVGNIKNDADVVITTTADGDDDVDPSCGADNGDVVVAASGGKYSCYPYCEYIPSEAYISAKAYNKVTADATKELNHYPWVQYGGTTINLEVQGLVENDADVLINAADDVMVIGAVGGYCGYAGTAHIDAEAYNRFEADGAKVKYGKTWYEYPATLNVTGDGTVDNYAGVDITTGYDIDIEHDVMVKGDGGSAAISADAYNERWVDDDGVSTVEISREGIAKNTADIAIDASGNVLVYGLGGDGYIEAAAYYGTNNSADVSIDADGSVDVTASGCEAGILAEAYDASPYLVDDVLTGGENKATVTLGTLDDLGNRQRIGGDVLVTADAGNAYIEAETSDGYKNTSNVLVCTDGTVEVTAGSDVERGFPGTNASIAAIANCGSENTAGVGVGAVGGVTVKAANRGTAEILSGAAFGLTNTADTIVCTKGDLIVAGAGGSAWIGSEAMYGDITDAYTGVCTEGDIWVASGFNPEDIIGGGEPEVGLGGEASIYSEAETWCEGLTADATTVAVSKKGSVVVAEMTGGDTAGITADAHYAFTNTASVGVAAGADLSPADVPTTLEDLMEAAFPEEGGFLLPPGGVFVFAGPGSDAQIMSHAYGAYGEGSSNTADTVVCAPGVVLVEAVEGGVAKIKSWAGQPWEETEAINTATTQVYASGVEVYVPEEPPWNGISAWAGGDHVSYCIEDGYIVKEEGGAKLIVGTYADRKDCPECPQCPCEEKAARALLAPVAPLLLVHIPRIEGCPELTLAAAAELGIPSETLQVGIGNALALNPSIQPCEACAALINAASILRDEDGSRMAAMVQVFNTLAPADAPFTPEMATSIAMAFEGAAEGSQYASVAEYIDAFTQYVAVLDIDLGSPVGDSTAFVMEKYGAGITGSDNANIAAFVAARIESGETF